MVLIIDNYDSFTYNLYQYTGMLTPNVEVYRNDKITISEVLAKAPSHIILSPGPGYPSTAGIMPELIKQAAGKVPMLGVCLGHQAIGEAFGGRIVHAPNLMHGMSSEVEIDTECPIFKGLNNKIEAGRYHSLCIEPISMPARLQITAMSPDGVIMGVKHKDYDVYGIQFHPESVLTNCGMAILRNFLSIGGGVNA